MLDILDHLGRPPGSYPESFVKVRIHWAEILRCVTFVTKRDRQTDKQRDRQTDIAQFYIRW